MGKTFNCPHCATLSKHDWVQSSRLPKVVSKINNHHFLEYRSGISDYAQDIIKKFLEYINNYYAKSLYKFLPPNLYISTCQACEDFSLWIDKDIIYPKSTPVDPPNNDLSSEIKKLYYEAVAILNDSPRGATAILRLALQMLLIQIDANEKSINTSIKKLVEKGLSQKIQQALDLLRVIGNNAVHPGQIDLNDDKEIAFKLFKILNIIADEMISKPKEIDELYNEVLPDETKKHIKQRDGGK